MIDLRENQSKASFIGRSLKKLGIPDIGSAIKMLAGTIRDHKHLETVLTGMSGEERQMVYDSILPHLRFTALPLDVYIARAGRRAEREQWPVQDADGKLREFLPARDAATFMAEAIAEETLTLTCCKCTKQGNFLRAPADTRVDTVIKARKAGWVYDPKKDRDICPNCPTSLRTDRIDA